MGVGTNTPETDLDVAGKIRMREVTAQDDPLDTVATKGYVDGLQLKALSAHGVTPSGDQAHCTGTFNGGLCDGGEFFIDVTFSESFSSPPHVIVTPENVSTQTGCVGGATDKVVARPDNITSSGFRLVVYGSPVPGTCGAQNGSATIASAGWLAIGR